MEIVKLKLENEMDLILSHKRSMKLAELCGLSVIIQTSFATAVSEISRCVIGDASDQPTLSLKINILKNNKKELVASIYSNKDFEKDFAEALKYAKRLANNVIIIKHRNIIEIQFIQQISFGGLINEEKLNSFVDYFKNELPLSPYDEIRKKNIQLLEISDKLQNSENQYKILAETLPLMIFTMNAGGNLNYGNKWLKDYFKLPDTLQSNLSWTSFVYNLESKMKDEWDKSLVTQTPYRTQAKLKSPHTEDFLWHLISITPVKDEQKKALSWKGFFVDIHAQKLVEETLKNNEALKTAQKQLLGYQSKLEEKIQELNKSNHDLEQFAYIASHDLQEPLRKIRTFADLLKENIKDEEKVEEYISKIDSSSSRMVTLIKDVLNYSSLSKVEDAFVSTNLQEIINNIRLDMELLIQDKNATITQTDLPVINGIPRQLYQLFYNLISNSLKFSKSKPLISITTNSLSPGDVKKHPDLHPNIKYIELIFKDNGIGFDEKYSKQIFTIFKRLHSKDSYAGTGIGLALCKKIVDNHYGLITVKSEVGKGSEFHIILPVE